MNRSSILAVASGIRKAQLNSLTRVQKQLCYQQCYASTSSTTVNIPEIKELNKTKVYTQGDAMREMYRASGLGWLARLTGLPVIKEVSDWMYLRFVPYRLRKAFARCESESDRCSTKLHQLRDKLKDSL